MNIKLILIIMASFFGAKTFGTAKKPIKEKTTAVRQEQRRKRKIRMGVAAMVATASYPVVYCAVRGAKTPPKNNVPVCERVEEDAPMTPQEQKKELFSAVSEKNLEKIRGLLEKGANIEAKDYDGRTPLHKAADSGKKDVVELLLEKGANIEAKNNSGWTPLHYVAIFGKKEVVELLLEKGANIEAKGEYGYTPLHEAAYWGYKEVVKLLLEKGADPNIKDVNGLSPKDIRRIRKQQNT